MKICKLLLTTLLIVLSALTASAQTITTETVTEALRNGECTTIVSCLCNAPHVSIGESHFSDKVSITKALTALFATEKPSALKVMHTGRQDNNTFCIATMTLNDQKYRIYILLKNNKLHELRIEQ